MRVHLQSEYPHLCHDAVTTYAKPNVRTELMLHRLIFGVCTTACPIDSEQPHTAR